MRSKDAETRPDAASTGSASAEERTCPFCKERVRSDARKCMHCASRLEPLRPSHEGTCPYCKGQINPEAVKCKYCKSDLGGTTDGDGDCVEEIAAIARRIGGGSPVGGGGQIVDPGHRCWQRCMDAYVACRRGGGDIESCRQSLTSCTKDCPVTGPV